MSDETRPATNWTCRIGLHRWALRDGPALFLGPAYFVRCTRCEKEAVRG